MDSVATTAGDKGVLDGSQDLTRVGRAHLAHYPRYSKMIEAFSSRAGMRAVLLRPSAHEAEAPIFMQGKPLPLRAREWLRGLHYQLASQNPQASLGALRRRRNFYVAVDIRGSSATFRQWLVTLSAEKPQLLWIPTRLCPWFSHPQAPQPTFSIGQWPMEPKTLWNAPMLWERPSQSPSPGYWAN